MVDVWEELGKAVGRALKPLADMGINIWKAFGDSVDDLITGLMGGVDKLKTQVEPTITGLLPSVFDEATLALGEDSPPKEIKEAVDKFITELMKKIEKESKTEGKSLPTAADLAKKQTGLVALILGMYAATHAVSIALDATHPLKDWGFKAAVMDVMFQFKMSDVIGPMIQAPIWASIITPMRMRARFSNPYDIPRSTDLPYLRAKGIITDKEYSLNMKYHALDETWSSNMLANTWRYPSFSELRTMIHRDVTTWADAKGALEKSLIHADYADKYEALLPAIPGSGDLITMMVREVITKADFIKNMKLQGFSAKWADDYYENHWVLLPLSEVKKARHRDDIDDDELDKFLVLHDYRPEARPGLKTSDRDLAAGLIWDRPGRIDARWLFRHGELDVTGLRDLLVDGGLDPKYANSVARATAKNQYLGYINREISNIKADYARGYSVEGTLRSDLGALGLRSDFVEYHIVDALADRERSIHDEELRTLRSQYARAAMTMTKVIKAVTPIIIDKEARDAWVAALPTAKQVIIMEETFTTEVNRLVANAKYDYVRGYSIKEELIRELQTLDFTDEVIELHVKDAEGDRVRKRNDERLIVIKDMWLKDVEPDFAVIEDWAAEIIRETEALTLWLDDTYFDKMRAVRIPEVPPKVPAVTVSILKTAFRSGIITATELAAELTARDYTAADINLIIAVEAAKIKPDKIPAMPLSTLKRAFHDQIITEDNFRDELIARNYDPGVITVMVAVEVKAIEEEMAVMPEQVTIVSLGTLRTAFREGIIDIDTFTSELTDRGYDRKGIGFIVAVEETRIKPEKLLRVPLSTLKRAFRDQIIDEAHFRVQLDARKYGPDDINLMVDVENMAIAEEMKVLPEEPKIVSLGTLRTAFREGIIDVNELIEELDDRGYGARDIELIIHVEESRITPEKVPAMPLSTLKRALHDQIISISTFRSELEARGFSQADISVMVGVEQTAIDKELAVMPEQVKTVSLGTLRMAFRLGVITEASLRGELVARGYGPDDVDVIVSVEIARMEE